MDVIFRFLLIGSLSNFSVIAPCLVGISTVVTLDNIHDSMHHQDVVAVGIFHLICDDIAEIIDGVFIIICRFSEHQVALRKIAALVAVGRAALHGVGLDGLDRRAEDRGDTARLRGQRHHCDQQGYDQDKNDQDIDDRV